MTMRRIARGCLRIAAGGAALGLVFSGCAVGPDFRSPAAPHTAGYTAAPLPGSTAAAPGKGGAPQRFVPGGEIPARWWELFRSDALDRWVRKALSDSPTLAAAEATLRQAGETRRARSGALFPSVDAGASAARTRISGAAFGQGASIDPFSLYNASVSVSYALDVFGGTRRDIEALQAQVDYEKFQLEGARLALSANVVTAAVQEASLRAQLAATQEILAVQERQLSAVEKQAALGAASQVDVLAQQAQAARTRATVPPLEKQLAQTRHLLAVLAGTLPGDAQGLPAFDLDGIHLPEELPVSLPSSLVRQRPDVRSAEELLHAASARVGVATANLYPQITLTGSYGTEALKVGDLFRPDSLVWGIGAGLLQPVFRGGTLRAERRAAVAAFDQAAASYRETVLEAFRNVADVLRALEHDAAALAAQSEAEGAARETFELAQKQFALGALGYISLLDAQRNHQQALIGLVQARATRLADTAALFQALGGGWWNDGGERS